MLSLAELTARHPSLLVLDAASERVQVGLRERDGPWRWSACVEGAGTGIFRCLETLGVDIGLIDAFAFCEGPGSILGIRTAAAALRTWQVLRPRPAYRYSSLELAQRGAPEPAVGIVADARRGLWHWYTPDRGLARVAAEALSGSLATPEGFKAWAALPAGTRTVPYDVQDLLTRLSEVGLFQDAPSPDAFLHEEPAYATWTPAIHKTP